MITLYVVSSERAAGKTAFSAAMGKRLLADGKKVGFLKPRLADGRNPVEGTDNDAAFMKQLLNLSEAADSLCPSPDKLKEAFDRASAGKDVVIVEGMIGDTDDNLGKWSYQVAGALNARVIAIEAYPCKPGPLESCKRFGSNLLGVVVNKVAKSRLKRAKGELQVQFSAAGVNLLGALPEDRVLLAPTVGDLADYVQGKILNGADKSADLVENLMVGALTVDSGLLYFGRKPNKAAIIRADRPDMQLAALETPTTCLVISGAATPVYYRVVDKAESKGIPLVQAESDITTIVARIEAALTRARFAQEKKVPKLSEMLQQSVDFKVLYIGLGLAN